MNTLLISCGTCRHPQAVRVSRIEQLDSDTGMTEYVSVKLKPRFWVRDTFGDGMWYGWGVADRAAVAALIFKDRRK